MSLVISLVVNADVMDRAPQGKQMYKAATSSVSCILQFWTYAPRFPNITF